MRDTDLFQLALGLVSPWYVADCAFDGEEKRLDLKLDFKAGSRFACPECAAADCPVHDTAEKTWRHLDFFQHQAFLTARVPRIKCAKCGARQVNVPWARPGSGFTLLFEALAMTLMQHMPVAAAARLVGVHDTRLWRVLFHYVEAALGRQDLSALTRLAIDETAARRGHDYITLFVDIDERKVVFIAEGRDAETLAELTAHLETHKGNPESIEKVCIDMSPAFIKGVTQSLPRAQITFDKFHVMQLIGAAVDQTRRAEAKSRPELKRSRYLWLKNDASLSDAGRDTLAALSSMNLKTARAWRLRLAFQQIYAQRTRRSAERMLDVWDSWAIRSRIEPVKAVTRTIRKHRDGILAWFDSRIANGLIEGINSLVQAAKAKARGYRNSRTLKAMTYLIAGKLDLRLPT
jgi:transposase